MRREADREDRDDSFCLLKAMLRMRILLLHHLFFFKATFFACRYEGIVPNYVRFGAIGASECDKEVPKLPPDDVYILIAPQVHKG